MVVSHQGQKTKSAFVLRLLSAVVMPDPQPFRPTLRRLAALASAFLCLLSCKPSPGHPMQPIHFASSSKYYCMLDGASFHRSPALISEPSRTKHLSNCQGRSC